MLLILTSLAAAADLPLPTPDPASARDRDGKGADRDGPRPDREDAPDAGPGSRPVFGVGAGLRGVTSSAGFVTGVRVRATPWLAFDPMVYVLTETSVEATTAFDADTTQETVGDEMTTYGALTVRARVTQGRRASGWVLAGGSVLLTNLDTSLTANGGGDPATTRRDTLAGNVNVGFGGEVWLRPDLTLSGDAGFYVFELSRIVDEDDVRSTVIDAGGARAVPFVQLALHLWL